MLGSRFWKRKWWALGLGLALSPLAIIAWKKDRQVIEAQTHEVRAGSIASRFFVHGRLDYQRQVRLSAEGVSTVLEIPVREGDTVQQGQTLVRLDDGALRDELQQVLAQLKRSRLEVERSSLEQTHKQSELQRVEDLHAKGMISRQKLDQARWDFENAASLGKAAQAQVAIDEAAARRVQRQVDKLWVKAPMSGVVLSVGIKPGEVAVASTQGFAGSELLHIADPTSLAVEAQLSELDVLRVKKGQRASVAVAALAGQTFTGRVVDVARRVQAAGASRQDASMKEARMLSVRIELDQADPRLIAGMSCDIALEESGSAQALLVPVVAVQYEEENPLSSMEAAVFGSRRAAFVWKEVGGRWRKTPVQLGMADENHQEVRQGLQASDRVLAGPPSLLAQVKDGDLRHSGGAGGPR